VSTDRRYCRPSPVAAALLASRPATKGGGLLDIELDQFQLLGTVPVAAVDALWPGFIPQDYAVHVNPVRLRRHMQSRSDYVDRVAALNQYGHRLSAGVDRATVYGRYDRVPRGEAGLNIFLRVEARLEPSYMQLGVRLLSAKEGRLRFNYVTTLLLVTTRRLHTMLRTAPHCGRDGEVDNVGRRP